MDLQQQIDELVLSGVVSWRPEYVERHRLQVDCREIEVRAVPSLAGRFLSSREPNRICDLCGMISQKELAVQCVPNHHGLVCMVNTWPYFESQLVVMSSEHLPDFNLRQWCSIGVICCELELSAMALQREGSGATVPSHAHVSLFKEQLPIYNWPVSVAFSADRISIATLPDHPSACYVIRADTFERERAAEYHLFSALQDRHVPFNAFWGHPYGTIIFPRSAERDPETNRWIGAPEIAGVIISGIDGFCGETVTEYQQYMLNESRRTGSGDWTGPVSRVGFPDLDENLCSDLIIRFG